MPRMHKLFCGGIWLLNAIAISAQNLPQRPTIKQVIDLQVRQQQKWRMKTLPQNSVLYKYNAALSIWRSHNFTFRKEKQPSLLSSVGLILTVPDQNLKYTALSGLLLSIQSYLLRQSLQYSKWYKNNWQKNPLKTPGGEIAAGGLSSKQK